MLMEAAPFSLALTPQAALPLAAAPPTTASNKRQGGRDTVEEIQRELAPPSNSVAAKSIRKVLAGNVDDLTESDWNAANTKLNEKVLALRKQAIQVARDTGCSIELVIKPNDAFSKHTRKKTFRTGYVNSFLAEAYGPDLSDNSIRYLDETRDEIWEHVRKLPHGASDKDLLKVADRLDYESVAADRLHGEADDREEAAKRKCARLEAVLPNNLGPFNGSGDDSSGDERAPLTSAVPALLESALTEAELPVVTYIKEMASDLFFYDISRPAWVVLDLSDGRSTKGIKDVYEGVERPTKKPNHPNNCLKALNKFLDNGYWRDLGLSDPRQFFTWIFGILQDSKRYKQVRARLNTVSSSSWLSVTERRKWDGLLFATFIRLLYDYGGQHGSIEEAQVAFEARLEARLL